MNCQELIMGDHRGAQPLSLTPHLFHRAVTTHLQPPLKKKGKKKKERKKITSKCVYIKRPCIKTCICAVQRSAILLGQYTFPFYVLFIGTLWSFLTGRGLTDRSHKKEREADLAYLGCHWNKRFYRQDNEPKNISRTIWWSVIGTNEILLILKRSINRILSFHQEAITWRL